MKLQKRSIAFKLGAVMSIAVIIGFAALTYFSVSFMNKQAGEKEVATLQAQVEQVLQVFELNDATLRQSANAIHRLLTARFPAGFSLDKSSIVAVNGTDSVSLKTGNNTVNNELDDVDEFTAATGSRRDPVRPQR